jgi:dephospho-CoA kinase
VTAVLVTGMSGTGKSSVLAVLAGRGHDTVDTDTDEWCEWADGDWIWRADRITGLLTAPRVRPLFVAGCKTNQGRFYPLFDQVVLLTAPVGVMLARIAARTSNPYGKNDRERAEIRANLAEVEPRLRATATRVIDATAPLDEVADQLERLTT